MIIKKALIFIAFAAILWGQTSPAEVDVNLAKRLGPLKIDRFGVGQGGMSPEPMWDNRVPEIRTLQPRVIRLFVQEYFNLLPEKGRYHWNTLDQSVETILKTGAKPLMCIAFKPKVLFPKIDIDAVTPSSWRDWEALIYNLVRHYRDKGGRGWYWEVANEPDIPTGGGTPYHFTAESYPEFYQRTVAAILRADPEARVGGPALAYWNSPILPALLDLCDSKKIPLHFVSWHGYNDDPLWFRQSVEGVKALLARHPSLQPETVINEWNMKLGVSSRDPRFQPAFIAETSYQLLEAGLDISCYYHIRDYSLATEDFLKFYPKEFTMREKLFWNRRPVLLGLFDFQNRVRPAYFLFKLLSHLSGDRVEVQSSSSVVHAIASYDEEMKASGILVWNFSASPTRTTLKISGIPGLKSARSFTLNSTNGSDDDSDRLHSLPPIPLKNGTAELPFEFEAYGVTFVLLE